MINLSLSLFFIFSPQERGFSLSVSFLNVSNGLRENNKLHPLSGDKAKVKDAHSVNMAQTGQHLEINSCSLITDVSDINSEE